MVFNGDSNDQDICTLADKQVKTDDIDFPLTEKALYANWGSREIYKAIYLAYGGWIEDDKNQTSIPEFTGNLTTNQFYPLPDDLQALHSIEWMDSSGSWHPLNPITLEEINDRNSAESEFMKTPGNPLFYRPLANGFKVYPAADTARNSAIRVKGTRDIISFTAASTNITPGFDSLFHEDLSVFMALTFADINTLARAAKLQEKWDGILESITDFYSSKYKQMFPPAIRHRRAIANDYVS